MRIEAHRISALLGLVVVAVVAAACTPSPAPTTTSTTAPPAASPTTSVSTQLFPLIYEVSATTSFYGSPSETEMLRIGFLDSSWRVVVEPVYNGYQTCSDQDSADVIVAQRRGTVDSFDVQGNKTGSITARGVRCGPLPGYATVSVDDSDTPQVVRLPDLVGTDLPSGLALDTETFYVHDYTRNAGFLYDVGTGTRSRLPSDLMFVGTSYGGVVGDRPSGEWPVPAPVRAGEENPYRYLNRDGTWATGRTFSQAGWFTDGHGWVGTSHDRAHFVDTSFTQVGQTYEYIEGIHPYGTSTLFDNLLGYTVRLPRGGERYGVVARDLTVLIDPAAETADCDRWAVGPHVCLATATDGSMRLVVLPEGTQTPLPEGFTRVLSEHLVTNDAGTQVHNLATGQTFDVPAPYAAVSGHADAYINVESPNGLRTVLDGTGDRTDLGAVERVVTATDGNLYFWAVAGNRHGYVDRDGRWMYSESRHAVMED